MVKLFSCGAAPKAEAAAPVKGAALPHHRLPRPDQIGSAHGIVGLGPSCVPSQPYCLPARYMSSRTRLKVPALCSSWYFCTSAVGACNVLFCCS